MFVWLDKDTLNLEEPLSSQPKENFNPFSKSDVDEFLTSHARAYAGNGAVYQIHVASVAANPENQDRVQVANIQNCNFIGVYDGHGATAKCSELLANVFHNYVIRHLGISKTPDQALHDATKEMDQDLVQLPHEVKKLQSNMNQNVARKALETGVSGAVAVYVMENCVTIESKLLNYQGVFSSSYFVHFIIVSPDLWETLDNISHF